MPELPEIETVKRVVGPQVTGSTIVSAQFDREKIVGHPSAERFAELVKGRTITCASRRGKALIFGLDDGSRVIIRFGMTGQLIVVPEDFPEEKHTHAVFALDDGRMMWYIDSRMFGRIWLVPGDEEDKYSGLGNLGPEPEEIDREYLRSRLENRSVTIKEALLDQRMVAGIGNIWSDEILFRSGICPETRCDRLTERDWKALAEQIPAVMEFGIEKNSVTPEEYLKGKGREYYDIDYLEAYGHAGTPCPRCGSTFERSVLGGRSSHWCPGCQRRR